MIKFEMEQEDLNTDHFLVVAVTNKRRYLICVQREAYHLCSGEHIVSTKTYVLDDSKQKEKHLTFRDVEVNQFFLDHEGDLCQKSNAAHYVVIAGSGGRPFSAAIKDVSMDTVITRILPRVTKITWE